MATLKNRLGRFLKIVMPGYLLRASKVESLGMGPQTSAYFRTPCVILSFSQDCKPLN